LLNRHLPLRIGVILKETKMMRKKRKTRKKKR